METASKSYKIKGGYVELHVITHTFAVVFCTVWIP